MRIFFGKYRFSNVLAPGCCYRLSNYCSSQIKQVSCKINSLALAFAADPRTTPTLPVRRSNRVTFSTRWFSSTSISLIMADAVENAVDVYRRICKYPSVKSGRISMEETPGHLQVYSEWSQKDLERTEDTKFGRGHIIQLDVVVPTPPHQLSGEFWDKESPSGRYRAVVRTVQDKKKGEDKQWIEIWTDRSKVRTINLEAAGRHGKIYDKDGHFGCLEWNSAETHLLYVAERKKPKSKSYFETNPGCDSESEGSQTISRGEEYVYQDNWGEQMTDKSRSVLCVLDVESGIISLLENLPESVCPGQAIWCPDDLGVVCVGYKSEPYRLGLIYCNMRPSAIFHIDLKTYSCSVLGANDRAVSSPVFSPDKTKFVYIENAAGGPHKHCNRLMMCDWSTKGIVTVVEQVRQSSGVDDFPGLFVDNLNDKCWSEDSKRIVVDTQWRSRYELVVIHVETGLVTRLTKNPLVGSWSLLDVTKDLILAACSSPSQPQYLVLGKLPDEGQETGIEWMRLDSEPEALSEISWKIVPVNVPDSRINASYPSLDYEYLLLEPTRQDDAVRPLVVFNHGGPHSAFVAGFERYFSAVCLCGYVVLMVNYRGSTGFGQDSIESLLGGVGRQDVDDIQNVVEQFVTAGGVDKNKVFVIGGSHGGFLTTHLIGQFPDFYRAAVARNPVINIASMLGVSDLPDWAYAVVGLEFDAKLIPTSETYVEMLKRSPIVNVDRIRTPLMLMIGGKDRRVPNPQALEMMRALAARGIEVKTLLYPECSHPITETKSEADAFVNIIKWFADHTKDN